MWKDGTGAVVRVVALDVGGAISIADANGRIWRTDQTGKAIVSTRQLYYSGVGCTGTAYTNQLAAREPFAVEDDPAIRVLADNGQVIAATWLSQRGSGGSCGSGGTGVVALLSFAPVDATLTAVPQMFVPPLHAEYVP